MRKFLRLMFLPVLILLCATKVFAQEKTVTGKIFGTDNQPLAGATIRVKGTNRIVQTDATGSFSIKVSKGQTLEITHVSYEPTSVKIGDSNLVSLSLKSSEGTMSEVVVTAMDIKRNPRELGYSVQTVKGSDIQETQRENFVNSLEGRVAGLTVTPTTGAAGSSTGIVLRGFNSTSGTNQPLFVVDGVIVDNNSFNSNSYGGAGVGLASDGANRNVDNTNRIADINPNDIESITVLKGPEATALYGSQASSGAIVITTKKGRGTQGKVRVTYDNDFRFQKVTRFADVNNEYGPGTSNGIPTAPPLSGQFTSFGPKWAPNTTLYDNLHHFYQTGFSQTHNLGIEWGNKNVAFRLSGQYFDSKGVIPDNKYTKYSFKVSNTTNIGKYITITPAIAYSNADNRKPVKGANSFLMALYEWPANNDVRNFEDDYGGKLTLFNANYNSDFDNPIWSAKNNIIGDKNERWIATGGIDYNPLPWLSLTGRFGYDTYQNDGYVFTHPQSYLLSASTLGTLDNYYRTYKGYNHTITATAKKKFGDFSTRLLVGTVWQDFETEAYGVFGNHVADSLVAGRLYKNGDIVTSFNPKDSSITLPGSRTRLLRNYFGEPNLNIFRELAYFGEVSVGFKNVVFVTYSHRFETASPIPKKNNNYNYPGASISAIISDIFPQIKKGNFINYLKLRASSANTARLNDPYSNQAVFVNNTSSSVVPGYTYGFTGTNPDLKPEKQRTYETGAELRLLNNKITFEIAYYNTLCTDQIAQNYRASYATGFVLNTKNAAELRNEGLEVSLGVTPLKKKDFTWNINFNFNHMWSEVLKIPESIGPLNDFYNSDTYISNVRGGLVRGHKTGGITGSIYQRNKAGQILIDPLTGLGKVTAAGDNRFIGERTPDFTLGTINSFRYKNWSLNFLWDLRVGGDIYNGTDQVLTGLGKSQRTADRMTPRVVQGVLADGFENTDHPTANTIVVTPYFQSTYYTTMPDEEFIEHDVNWMRLRDLTLNYRLTKPFIKHVREMSFFITGNDLIVFSNYSGADAAVNANNPGTRGVGGYGLDLGSAPTPISINFGLRANF
ncbi:MAG TPA: SusC/RagA family TonB-linked outer membrane protein [Chitinophagaceae bacterium]|jgi:TonB-linked SusC/RagA family outer membrane protein|nr:SusC/RagA family TonB-linked outer membrane protein [Chitinophagaceae bacterium]